MRRSSRNAFSFPDFSLRRILLQGARAARGSPPLGRMCDIEKGNSSSATGSSGGGGGSGVGGLGHASSPPLAATGGSTGNHSKSYNDKQSSSNNLHGTPHNKTGHTSSNSVASSPGLDMTPSSEKHLAKGTIINECPLCYNTATPEELYALSICNHAACRKCLERYLYIEITESRTDIACPQCSESMHPSDIQALLRSHPVIMTKYEDFMVRRVLLSDPDSRWCPAPNCSYAVIASGCASCPLIRCERPGCLLSFCYHCKAEWHPDQTCDAARASRQSPTRAGSGSISQDSQHRDDIKPCPRCQVLIVKMNDGSCNHMVCAVCGSEFCWLCMKEISDLHYLSPSGCTFWGKKPWSRKKKLLWQLGTLVGAPVGIALVAGIAVPAMIIGIPVWVGRKIHTRYKLAGKHKRNCAVLSAVTASVLVAPVLAAFAVAIGVPILLFYVYGVVPVSLCRAGCGVSTTRDGFKFDIDEEEYTRTRNQDATSVDAVSRIGATSIGEVSLSVASGPLGALNHPATAAMLHSNRESTTALAGSIGNPTNRLEVQADVSTSETASTHDAASTKALAGSILSHNPHTDSEDGASVRFDKCYVIDGKRESDVWFINQEQDHGADKLSLGSGRSLRSSERSYRDEIDSMSLSSGHKRMVLGQRMSKLNNRNMSMESTTGSSNCIAENEHELCGSHETSGLESIVISSVVPVVPQIELDAGSVKTQASIVQLSPTPSTTSSRGSSSSAKGAVGGGSSADNGGSPTLSSGGDDGRNMSKTAILRNIFFSQIATPSSTSPPPAHKT